MKHAVNLPEVPANFPRLGNRFSRWLGVRVLSWLGWRFDGQFPNHAKMVIAVAPHTSNWDFVIGLAAVFALRLKITFFGKHSIFIPPFDRLLRRWGGIPIERSKAHGVVEQMVREIKTSEQLILALAPEGTRSRVDHWKSGFMHIATQAEIPVLLIALDYASRRLVISAPFKPSGDIQRDMQHVYDFFKHYQAKYPENAGFPSTGEQD